MTGIRLNIIATALVLLLGFFQYRLWFDAGGLMDMLKLKKALVVQQRENDKVKQANEQLLFQVKRLHGSQDEVESRARNELGMMKKGETFYQIVN